MPACGEKREKKGGSEGEEKETNQPATSLAKSLKEKKMKKKTSLRRKQREFGNFFCLQRAGGAGARVSAGKAAGSAARAVTPHSAGGRRGRAPLSPPRFFGRERAKRARLRRVGAPRRPARPHPKKKGRFGAQRTTTGLEREGAFAPAPAAGPAPHPPRRSELGLKIGVLPAKENEKKGKKKKKDGIRGGPC